MSLVIESKYEKETLKITSDASLKIFDLKVSLEEKLKKAKSIEKIEELSMYLRTQVLTCMEELRCIVDSVELIVGKEYWPFISYGDLLYSVK